MQIVFVHSKPFYYHSRIGSVQATMTMNRKRQRDIGVLAEKEQEHLSPQKCWRNCRGKDRILVSDWKDLIRARDRSRY